MLKVNICSSRNLMEFLSKEEGYGLLKEVKIEDIYISEEYVKLVAFDESRDTVLILKMSLEELQEFINKALKCLFTRIPKEYKTHPKMAIELKKYALKYQLIPLPRKYRLQFPSYGEEFTLLTDIGEIPAKVTSKYKREENLEKAGNYIKSVKPGELGKWYRKHPELKPGSKIIIEILEPKRKYKLLPHNL